MLPGTTLNTFSLEKEGAPGWISLLLVLLQTWCDVVSPAFLTRADSYNYSLLYICILMILLR